jgi:glutathione S-transferase
LSAVLGDKQWLEDRFTIGDLTMIDVLRAAREPGMVSAHPNLVAYIERGTSRPAFKAAMAAQLAAFARNEPVPV